MIRELRLRHLRMIQILTFFAAVVFVSAITTRKPIPSMEENPLAIADAPLPTGEVTVTDLNFLTLQDRLRAKVYQGSTRVLEVEVLAPLKTADPLVYGSPAGMNEARLLGPLPPLGKKTYVLDAAHGAILVYSLPRQEVIDRAVIYGTVDP